MWAPVTERFRAKFHSVLSWGGKVMKLSEIRHLLPWDENIIHDRRRQDILKFLNFNCEKLKVFWWIVFMLFSIKTRLMISCDSYRSIAEPVDSWLIIWSCFLIWSKLQDTCWNTRLLLSNILVNERPCL